MPSSTDFIVNCEISDIRTKKLITKEFEATKMGSVKDLQVIQKPTQTEMGTGRFLFS